MNVRCASAQLKRQKMGKYKRVDTYNKLVRDNIPAIIEADGLKAETRVLSPGEVVVELKKKIIEEASEFIEAETVDDIVVELADLKEVELALMKQLKINPELVEKVRQERREKRGGFEGGIYLMGTKEK